MIHTMQLSWIPNMQRKAIFDAFRDHEGTEKIYSIEDPSKAICYYNSWFKDLGLQFWCKFLGGDYRTLVIICRVNISKLLHPDDSISLMTPKDIPTIETNFNKIIKELPLPELEYWNANRIDFCINIVTPYVERYLTLLKKGNHRSSLQDWYDNGTKSRVQKEGSLYYVSTANDITNRSVTVNFYDKRAELCKKHFQIDEEAQAFDEEAEAFNEEAHILPDDILRLEIQVHARKLENDKSKFDINHKTIMNYFDLEMSHYYIGYYLNSISGLSDYHRKSVALSMIEDAKNIQPKTKKKMREFINDVAHSSVYHVRQKGNYDYMLSKLKNMNLNPVTIPDTAKLKDKSLKEGLPNLNKLVFEEFDRMRGDA